MMRMAFALAAVLAATPVNAQTSSASHLVGSVPRATYEPFRGGLFNSLPYTNEQGREERRLNAYADCVVRHDPAGSGDYLRHSLGDTEPARYMKLRAATRSCYTSSYDDDLLATKSIRTAAIADAARRRIARMGHL